MLKLSPVFDARQPFKLSMMRLRTITESRAMPPGVDKAAKTDDDAPTRSEMLRKIVRDWLIGHGFLKHRDDPEGANGR